MLRSLTGTGAHLFPLVILGAHVLPVMSRLLARQEPALIPQAAVQASTWPLARAWAAHTQLSLLVAQPPLARPALRGKPHPRAPPLQLPALSSTRALPASLTLMHLTAAVAALHAQQTRLLPLANCSAPLATPIRQRPQAAQHA